MRLEFPAADELRNGAVEDEWIEQVDVVDHEETGALGIEARRTDDFHARTGEKRDAAAEIALQPIVLAHVQEDIEKDEKRRGNEKVNEAESPERHATDGQIGALHMCMSTAAGMISSERISRLAISPSIITSTGAGRLNWTQRTARRSARGCWICMPS